jgi:two-component system response regulator HydG
MSEALRKVGAPDSELAPIIGDSPAMRRAVELGRRFAPSRVPILLVGPTGSGKELLAQHIHVWGRRPGPLIDINCGALPKELIESELFGRCRGAFSGAVDSRAGLIEAAEAGTVFLDEICSMPLEAQIKFLRVLDTMCVRRVGETISRRVDFRLIAATQDRLGDRVSAGTFRLDLLQRIAGVVIELPALTERREDIVPLARAFAATCGKLLPPSATDMLLQYTWPGNARELRHVMERASWLAIDREIPLETLQDALSIGPVSGTPPLQSAAVEERAALLAVCETSAWHAGRIAKHLGIGRTTLYRRLLDHGISLRQRKRMLCLRADRNPKPGGGD